jgi:hypothetical protein
MAVKETSANKETNQMEDQNAKHSFNSISQPASIFAAVVLALSVLACSSRVSENGGSMSGKNDNQTSTQTVGNKPSGGIKKDGDDDGATASSRTSKQSQNPDNGDFKALYSEIQNPKYVELNEQMKQQKVLEKIADSFNQELSLPYDVSITFRDCGQPNAFYTSQNKTITMCYEFMELFYDIFTKKGNSDADSKQMMLGATDFFILHELGHCLIDVYDLPATGREEDSVDQLSTYILVRDKKESDYASVMSGIVVFKALGENDEASARVFADEHSLSSQRFYNLACWMYGSDPQLFSFMVQQGILPEARAARCPEEYEKMSRAWERLVDPWIKK